MIDLQLRISPKLVRQIAAIERLSGRLEKTSLAAHEESGENDRAIRDGSIAAMRLDSTVSPMDISPSDKVGSQDTSSAFQLLLAAHSVPFSPDIRGICSLYAAITGAEFNLEEDDIAESDAFRKSVAPFSAPAAGKDEIIFSTIQPFLAPKRFADLVEWLQQELEEGTHHPLLLIGTFHLLFLQTSPFPQANHRVALVTMWHLLKDQEYTSVQFRHIAPALERSSKAYFAALRQAEKTALTTWASCNGWLELFLTALESGARDLLESAESRIEKLRLTVVQKKIFDIIKTEGPVTREKIADVSGINISTVKYNLRVLSARGVLNRLGGGRTTSYTVFN